MTTTDPRLFAWLGSPWSRECDICGVVTTDPERTARHKAWHALVDVLIAANDTGVSHRDADDGARKGSTTAGTGARSDARPAEAPGEGRSEIGPQKGAQSLGDDLRDEASELCALANGKPYVVGVRPQDLIGIAQELDDYAARADALTTERDRLAAWKAEATVVLTAYDDLAKRVVPEPTLGRNWSDMLAEHVDALTTERDRLAADIAIMRDVDLTATDVQRRRAVVAEGDRDDARAELRSLRRAAQVTDASWREHVERAEKAEAAVAQVRALLDEWEREGVGSHYGARQDLRAALDHHQQHDERPVSGAGMGERG